MHAHEHLVASVAGGAVEGAASPARKQALGSCMLVRPYELALEGHILENRRERNIWRAPISCA